MWASWLAAYQPCFDPDVSLHSGVEPRLARPPKNTCISRTTLFGQSPCISSLKSNFGGVARAAFLPDEWVKEVFVESFLVLTPRRIAFG